MVSAWFPCGFLAVFLRFSVGSLLVSWRFPGGSLLVPYWLPGGFLMVSWRFSRGSPLGSLFVPCWFPGGSLLVPWWLPGGFLEVPHEFPVVIFSRFSLGFLFVSWWFPGSFLAVPWWFPGGFLARSSGFLVLSWRFASEQEASREPAGNTRADIFKVQSLQGTIFNILRDVLDGMQGFHLPRPPKKLPKSLKIKEIWFSYSLLSSFTSSLSLSRFQPIRVGSVN